MSNPRYQTLNSATRAAAKLDSLLTLSRSLGGSCQDGVASDALDLLLAATGYTRGAAFILENDALELVAHRALPEHLRAWIQRLPLAEPSWFVAQVAVHARALVSAVTVSTAQSLEIGPAAFAAAGWAQAVACPIAAGREIHGVMVLANPVPAEPDDALKAAVEIACCLLALQIPHRSAERRIDAASASQMAALGVLTCGLASELDDRLGSIARDLHRQEQLADRLKRQVSGAHRARARSHREERGRRAPARPGDRRSAPRDVPGRVPELRERARGEGERRGHRQGVVADRLRRAACGGPRARGEHLPERRGRARDAGALEQPDAGEGPVAVRHLAIGGLGRRAAFAAGSVPPQARRARRADQAGEARSGTRPSTITTSRRGCRGWRPMPI